MYIHYIMYACVKYETYFKFNDINIKESSDELIPKYRRLREILRECHEKKLSDEEASNIYKAEVGELFYAIKCREFVCKVGRVAY